MITFLKRTAVLIFLGAMAVSTFYAITHRRKVFPPGQDPARLHPALYAEQLDGSRVRCRLCPNRCVLSPDEYGECKARKNVGGRLYSMVYGQIASAHVDPIEKKPFFHVLPGASAFSIATTGCNMRCLFCQNWEISQAFPSDVPTQSASPEEVVRQAVASGAQAIAFTYTEPVIFYEYLIDIARLARQAGLKNLVVSNGYIEQEPLKELLKYVDAYKVDFKAFDDAFYEKMTQGRLEPVLRTMKTIKESGVWLEIVHLLVTGQNDRDEQIRGLARWIRENLGDGVPLHFSRYFPQYKLLNVPPTPDETVIRARKIALEEGLKYVYTGNIAYPDGETTVCPGSGEKAVVRRGMFTVANYLRDGACPDGEKIPGVWK